MLPTVPLRSVSLHPSKRSHRLGRHPWILSTSIVEPSEPLALGEPVDLLHTDGRWLGRGLYNPTSRIRLRMYTWDSQQKIDGELFDARLDSALELRRTMASHCEHDAMRLVFSEADQLSGLIVDRFGAHLVIQLTAGVLLPWIDRLVERLIERLVAVGPVTSVTLQLDEKTARSEGVEPCTRHWIGEPPVEPILLRENGLLWSADLRHGQKTGYYLDQRDNRLAAARWTPAGGRVLDVCTYAGGFALTIAKHAYPASINAIDSSPKALEMARENAVRNGLGDRVEWEQNDFFKALSDRVDAREQFDMIVLDPPRLAGARDQLARAMAAYHRLNYLSVRLLRPGGILVTCSCSGRVTRRDFLEMLQGVSVRTHREVQILENRGASPDHPVSVNCPETDYLKCVIARVQ